MTFTISLSNASGQGVWVNYKTANGTATTGDNNLPWPSQGRFTSPRPWRNHQDYHREHQRGHQGKQNDEKFYVNLSGAMSGAITDGQGVGTILNDDGVSTASSRLVRVGG